MNETWCLGIAAVLLLAGCKSDEEKERETLAPYLARARPFLDGVRKASTPPGSQPACAGKPVPQPTVVFDGSQLKQVFDVSIKDVPEDSPSWRNPQGHPCFVFGASKSLAPLERYVQKNELALGGKTVGGAVSTAECGEGIASFVVFYTTERVDPKPLAEGTYAPGHAVIRSVVYTKAGVPACEETSRVAITRLAQVDSRSAASGLAFALDIDIAKAVKGALGLGNAGE